MENLASAFPLLMAWLWRQKDLRPEDLKQEEVQQFIRKHADVLDHAVDVSLREVPLDEVSVRRLKDSNYVFSGIKTFHELNEALPSLVGDDGRIKPFNQFLKEVQKINSNYNVNYLRTEYNLAQASSLMAARWHKFEQDGDRYLLQYRTVGDKRVRRSHRMLHGITLPITSKFWNEYFPPNNWNCFQEGTPVLMADGSWKRIEEIQKGESVVGGSGEKQLVIGTHVKLFDGEAVRITTERGSATCTPNHRFLTICGWVTAGCLQPGDILVQVGKVSPFDVIVNAVHNTVTLIRYGLMALKRKWEASWGHTVNDQTR